MSFAKELLFSDVDYSAWSNHQLLENCATCAAGELECNLSVSHSSVLETLRHIFDGERVWLDCLSTTKPGETWLLPQGEAPKLSLHELRQKWPEIWCGFRYWFQEIPERDLAVEIVLQLPGGVEPPLARWRVLRHVLDHSQFHRGQIVGMLRGLGHTPPAINRLDYWLSTSRSGA